MPYELGEPMTNSSPQEDFHPEKHTALEDAVNDLDARVIALQARLDAVRFAPVTGWWDYNTGTTPPPAKGQLRTLNTESLAVGDPATIWLSATDDDGLYWEGAAMAPGEELRLRGTLGAVQHYTITSAVVTVSGADGYATIQAVLAAANQAIAKNARVEVALIRGTP